MGILRSVALGKSRKSAGELTFYQRIGVPCFRQKPARSPGYKSSVPQRMQQSVFRFMKANMDAANLKSYVDLFYDAKPRKNKSETKMNMFYRAFMPHLVDQKPTIYNLPADDLVQPGIFLGSPATNNDKLTNGQLGDLVILAGSASSFTVSIVVLDQIIDKANTLISSKEIPFTTDNIFVGLVASDLASPTKYRTVGATNIVPTLANDIYTFDISAIATGIDAGTTAYIALLVAGKDEQGDIDITRRKFATDSAKLQGNVAPAPQLAILSANVASGNKIVYTMNKAAMEAVGAVIDGNNAFEVRANNGTTIIIKAGIAVGGSTEVTITEATAGTGTISSVTLNPNETSQLWTSPDIDDPELLGTITNSVTVVRS